MSRRPRPKAGRKHRVSRPSPKRVCVCNNHRTSTTPTGDSESDSAVDFKEFFSFYGDVGIHLDMVRDKLRTGTYARAIFSNLEMFRGAVVLDVGAGSGILSLLAARAGARHVIAVEPVAHRLCAEVVRKNRMDKCITIITQPVEKASQSIERCLRKLCVRHRDPSTCNCAVGVDVLISEWMGYGLFLEGMLASYLYARDNFLKPAAHTPYGKRASRRIPYKKLMFPHKCFVSMAPFTSPRLRQLYGEQSDIITSKGHAVQLKRSNKSPSSPPPTLPDVTASSDNHAFPVYQGIRLGPLWRAERAKIRSSAHVWAVAPFPCKPEHKGDGDSDCKMARSGTDVSTEGAGEQQCQSDTADNNKTVRLSRGENQECSSANVTATLVKSARTRRNKAHAGLMEDADAHLLSARGLGVLAVDLTEVACVKDILPMHVRFSVRVGTRKSVYRKAGEGVVMCGNTHERVQNGHADGEVSRECGDGTRKQDCGNTEDLRDGSEFYGDNGTINGDKLGACVEKQNTCDSTDENKEGALSNGRRHDTAKQDVVPTDRKCVWNCENGACAMKALRPGGVYLCGVDATMPLATDVGLLDGFCVWFAVKFPQVPPGKETILSTSPFGPQTHWGQVCLPLKRAILLHEKSDFEVDFSMQMEGRDLRFTSVHANRKQSWLME